MYGMLITAVIKKGMAMAESNYQSEQTLSDTSGRPHTEDEIVFEGLELLEPCN
jgi:hypothetical protein